MSGPATLPTFSNAMSSITLASSRRAFERCDCYSGSDEKGAQWNVEGRTRQEGIRCSEEDSAFTGSQMISVRGCCIRGQTRGPGRPIQP